MTTSKKNSSPNHASAPTTAFPASLADSSNASPAVAKSELSNSYLLAGTDGSFRPAIQSIHDNIRAHNIVESGATTDDTTPTLSGSAQPNTQVEIHNQNGLIGDALTGHDGTWTFSVPGELIQGEHQFKVISEGVESEPFLINIKTPPTPKPGIESVFDNYGEYGLVANGGTTDDNTPTLRGTAQPNTQVEIHNQFGLIGYAYTNYDGEWTFETGQLPQGEHQFKVISNGVESETFLINIETPSAPKPVIESVFDNFGEHGNVVNGGTTDDKTPKLSGTAKPDFPVEIHNQFGLIGYAFSGRDGKWTFSVPRELTEGEHQFKVISNGVESETFLINIETPSAPKPVIDSVFDNFGEQGEVANGGTTDDKTPTLNGTAQPFTRIEIHNQFGLIGYAYTGNDGKWTFPVTGELTEGEHQFKVIGNGVESETFLINIETPSAPKPVIDSVFDNFGEQGEVANGGTTDDKTPTLNGTAQPFTRIEIHNQFGLVGYAYTGPDGKWTFETRQLPQGEHQFKIIGNGVESETFLINIETPSAPKPVINSVFDNFGEQGQVANGGTTDDKTPTLNGTAQPFTRIEIHNQFGLIGYAYTGPDGKWTFETRQLPQGEHQFKVISNGVESETFLINIETPSAPKPVIDSVFDNFGEQGQVTNGGTTDDKTPTLNGTAQPFTRIEIHNQFGLIGYAYTGNDGKWTFPVTWELKEGEHQFKVTSNGVESETFLVNIVTGPASRPVIDSVFDNFGEQGEVANGGTTDDKTPTLSGTAKPFAQIAIHNQFGLIGYAYTGPDGKWTFETGQLPQGEHQFKVISNGVESETFLINIETPSAPKPAIDSVFDNFGEQGEVANGGTTDDKTPTLNGTAQPFTRIEIHNQFGLVGYAYTGPDGKWTFETRQLPQGEHQFKVISNGVESETFLINIETPSAPKPVIESVFDNFGEQGNVANGGTTDDKTPTLSGTAKPFAQIAIHNQFGLVGYAYTGPDGKWTFETGPLPQGEHQFKVISDGVESDPFLVNIVTGPASRPVIDSVFDNFGEQGEVANGGTTDDRTPILSGTASPNRLVEIHNQFGRIGYAFTDHDGKWTFSVPSEMKPREYQFKVISDGVESDPFLVNIVTPPPPKPVIESVFDNFGEQGEVVNGGTTDDKTPILSGTASPNGLVEIHNQFGRIGYAFTDHDGKWTFPVTVELTEGEHQFKIISKGVESEPFRITVEEPPATEKLMTEASSAESNGGYSDNFMLNIEEPTPPLTVKGLRLEDVLSSSESELFTPNHPTNFMEPAILTIDIDAFITANMAIPDTGAMEHNRGTSNTELQRLYEQFETV